MEISGACGRLQAICDKGFVINGIQNGSLTYKMYGFAQISANNDSTVPVGQITISNGRLLPDTASALLYFWNDTDTTGKSCPTFGTISNWGIDGNPTYNIPSFTTTMYAPQVLTCSASVASVSKQNVYPVSWNVDGNNSYGIFIKLIYVNRSNNDITQWDTTISDNGSFSVPSHVLQLFPDSSNVDIAVGRGNYKVYTDSAGRSYLIVGTSLCIQEIKILP